MGIQAGEMICRHSVGRPRNACLEMACGRILGFREPAPALSRGGRPGEREDIMKIASIFAVGLIGFCGAASLALAEDAHTMFAPGDIKWVEAPKVLPAGAQAAV